jgi:hypothetical protein
MTTEDQVKTIEDWLTTPGLSYDFKHALRVFWLYETVRLWRIGASVSDVRMEALELAIAHLELTLKS